MIRKILSPALIVWSIAGLFSCDRIPGVALPEPSREEVLRAPRKEDVFVLDGQPFTLAEFYSLQENYPTLSPENVLRLAAYSMIEWRDRSPQVPGMNLKNVSDRIRPMLPPVVPGLKVNAESQKTEESRLRDRLNRASTVWNSGLLREIRIETQPWG